VAGQSPEMTCPSEDRLLYFHPFSLPEAFRQVKHRLCFCPERNHSNPNPVGQAVFTVLWPILYWFKNADSAEMQISIPAGQKNLIDNLKTLNLSFVLTLLRPGLARA